MNLTQDQIVYQARRLGNIRWAAAFAALSLLESATFIAALIPLDAASWQALVVGPLTALCIWMTWSFLRSAIWPPRLTISTGGISWSNFHVADARYSWAEIDGPRFKTIRMRNEIAYVCFTERVSGHETCFSLIDLGSPTFDEVASAISSARAAR